MKKTLFALALLFSSSVFAVIPMAVWFGVSLAIHAAAYILLSYDEPGGTTRTVSIRFSQSGTGDTVPPTSRLQQMDSGAGYQITVFATPQEACASAGGAITAYEGGTSFTCYDAGGPEYGSAVALIDEYITCPSGYEPNHSPDGTVPSNCISTTGAEVPDGIPGVGRNADGTFADTDPDGLPPGIVVTADRLDFNTSRGHGYIVNETTGATTVFDVVENLPVEKAAGGSTSAEVVTTTSYSTEGAQTGQAQSVTYADGTQPQPGDLIDGTPYPGTTTDDPPPPTDDPPPDDGNCDSTDPLCGPGDTYGAHAWPTVSASTFYESKYPDGIGGVWGARGAELQGSAFLGAVNGLGLNGIAGECPSWSISFTVGNLGDFGTGDISPPCWVWDAIGLMVMLSAAFASRRIVFGG